LTFGHNDNPFNEFFIFSEQEIKEQIKEQILSPIFATVIDSNQLNEIQHNLKKWDNGYNLPELQMRIVKSTTLIQS